ncbi:MAG: recombinase family protein [Peptococcaceae bacterium]|nr:recombinase family protein [Peptococcaceae bacterium]
MYKPPAVSYCRVSKNEKDQKNSLVAQKSFFQKETENLGFELVKIYADEGISGKSLEKRDQFNLMVKEAAKGDFEYILVKDISRFARNVSNNQDIVRDLRKYGVYVYFLKERICTKDITDEVFMNIFASIAQNELVVHSARVQFGLREAQKKGKWTSQPPYGYDRQEGYLKINESESKIVKQIFQKYINGMSLNKIAQNLNDSNIKSKKGSKWDGTGIRNIIKYPIYKGLQICHQVETKDLFTKLREYMEIEDYITHQKKELRIINDDTFHKAQEELKKRASMFDQGKRYSTENVLSNLFYCGNCGSTMKRFERTKNHAPFYMCRSHHTRKFCNYSNYAREDSTIEYIKNEIKNFEFIWNSPGSPESIKELYEQYIIDNLNDDLIDDLPSIQEKITKLESRKNNLIDMRADGEISKEEYLQKRIRIENELEPLLREKKIIDNLVQEREKVWSIYEQFCKNIKEFDTNNLNNIELRKIINKITIKTEGEKKIFYIDWNNGLDKGFDQILEEYVDNKLIDTYSGEFFYEIYDFDK